VRQGYAQGASRTKSEPMLSTEEIASTVERYLPLVASQVDRVWLSPRIGLTRDDLISAGCYGLLLAARRFDPTRGVGFGVFARSHVHGAVMREINSAMSAAGGQTDDVLAADAASIDVDSLPDERSDSPIDSARVNEVRDLMECVLTEQERLALTLYFYEELTIREVTAVTNTSESITVRIIKRALNKLKTAMAGQESL
jgi:RNA polymerase sigma factor FliA